MLNTLLWCEEKRCGRNFSVQQFFFSSIILLNITLKVLSDGSEYQSFVNFMRVASEPEIYVVRVR